MEFTGTIHGTISWNNETNMANLMANVHMPDGVYPLRMEFPFCDGDGQKPHEPTNNENVGSCDKHGEFVYHWRLSEHYTCPRCELEGYLPDPQASDS